MDEIKAHGDNGWRDALDDVIVSYTGEPFTVTSG